MESFFSSPKMDPTNRTRYSRRDQARADATGLLGRAASSLQQQGNTFATWAEIEREARRLAAGSKEILGAGPGTPVNLGMVGSALGDMDLLQRITSGPTNPFRLKHTATEGTGLSALQQQIQRDLILEGRTIPTDLFRAQPGSEVQGAKSRVDQLMAGMSTDLAGRAKGLVDLVVSTFEQDGSPKFQIAGQSFMRNFLKGAADRGLIGAFSDDIGKALGQALLERAQQSGF